MRKSPALAVIGLALLTAACNPFNSSPTESSSYELSVAATLSNAEGVETIRQVELAIDGEKGLGGFLREPPAASIPLYSLRFGVERGRHTATVTLLSQTTPRSTYQLTNIQAALSQPTGLFTSKTIKTVSLPDRTVELAPGDRITLDFDL